MAIYPEKTAKGFTGVWIVEKTRAGVRTRERFKDHAEALAYDVTGVLGQEPRARPLTLGDLHDEGVSRLWVGTKDRRQSEARLLGCVKRLGRAKPVEDIDYTTLEDLVEELRADSLSGKTCNRYLAALSKLLKWGVRAKRVTVAPPVPWQRETKGRQAWLPVEMTEAFLRTIYETSGAGHAFAAEVLLLTGMRVSELLTLEPHEVVGDVIELSKTKTDYPRSLPIPEGYGDLLRIFTTQPHGRQYDYRKLLIACTRASEVLGLTPKVTPHVLRHTVATRLNREGVPTLTVARIMGHKSLKTTEGYTHHEVSSLKQSMVTLVSGTRGAIGLQSKPHANLETIETVGECGGLGGNRTPVQGFAGLPSRPRKPQQQQ
jgi:integrase